MCVRWVQGGRDYGHDYWTPHTLELYRRVLNRIHEGGSIWYDADRYKAYALVAKLASDLRHNWVREEGLCNAHTVVKMNG